jgi:hypothetical protein
MLNYGQWQGHLINYENKVWNIDDIITIQGILKIGIICFQNPLHL